MSTEAELTTGSGRMLRLTGTVVELAALLALVLALALPATLDVPGAFAARGGFDTIFLLAIDRWVIVALAMALGALGFSLRRDAPAFGVLAFVFVAGGASQLYVTEPLWFATLHLRPQNLKEWVMVVSLAAEVAAAGAVLWQTGPRLLLHEARDRLGIACILILVALSALLSVPVLGYVGRGAVGAYAAHVATGGLLIMLHLTVLAAMSLVKIPITGVYRLSPVVPATVTVLASLALAWFAFERLPHVEDELAYLFQARTFAGGALSVPAPPEAAQAGLEYYLFAVDDGRWYSVTAPGWPLALAIGMLFGVPWLVNPLLAGVSVLLAHDIARRKAGRDQADMVALLMGFSPWLIAAAGSLMTHTLTLALTLFAWWMVLRAGEQSHRAPRRLLLAGLALGWVFAARPLDGLIIGTLTGLWVFFGPRGTLRRALIYSAGCIAVGLLLLAYNAHFTGSPIRTPLGAYLDVYWGVGANGFGFGPGIGPSKGWGTLDLWPGHSPLEGLINTVNMVASLQFEMLGWSIGSLALIFAYVLWQRPKGFDGAMIAVIVVLAGALFFYWFADTYYIGPRYWFLAAFPLFYLAARGYEALRQRFPGTTDMAFVRIDSVLWLCCLFGLLVFTPWRGVTKYNEYGLYYPDVRDDLAEGRFGNAVVLVEKVGNPGSALMLNDPWLSGPGPVFLSDTGTLDEAALVTAFPGRPILRYTPGWER